MVNWAPLLKTAVSDLEVEYSEEEGKLYYFKYMVEGSEGMFRFLVSHPVTVRSGQILTMVAKCLVGFTVKKK